MDKYKVAVVGASGYAGIDLVRLILAHPGFELVAATAESDQGQPLAERYPALYGATDMVFCSVQDLDNIDLDAVFLAVPHTAAIELATRFWERDIMIIDLSADFRLKDPSVYESWYNNQHGATWLLRSAVYGLPELYRSELLKLAEGRRRNNKAGLVACPGCYPTASALAIAPAIAAGAMLPGHPVVVSALSGASGMGRKPTDASHFVSINENARAYNVAKHRHTPEIEQTLSEEAGQPILVQFTPHLVPMTRGIISTVTLSLLPGLNESIFRVIYSTAYDDEPFVKLLPPGHMPETKSVSGTNLAHIGIAFDARTDQLIASCAIDNLGKGASAQAIQCANIVFGHPETLGLETLALTV